MTLTADQMLAGASLRDEVEVPLALLAGWQTAAGKPHVVLKPLAVRDLQRIQRAAKDDETLTATLMIQHAMLEPELKLEQIAQLPAGLASFLVDRINAISGVSASRDSLEEMVQAPLARACFVLAREFGWTPEDVSGMTVGQILVFLEMSRRKGDGA
jgi:hypothetical protein